MTEIDTIKEMLSAADIRSVMTIIIRNDGSSTVHQVSRSIGDLCQMAMIAQWRANHSFNEKEQNAEEKEAKHHKR